LNTGAVILPDGSRHSTAADFFTWLATNNGANRELRAEFASASLRNHFDNWSRSHQPALAAA